MAALALALAAVGAPAAEAHADGLLAEWRARADRPHWPPRAAAGAPAERRLSELPPSTSFVHGGASREFYHLGPTSGGPFPLMIDLHAGGTSALYAWELPTWSKLFYQTGSIAVAWPEGINQGWNAGGTICDGFRSTADDVDFIDEVINIMKNLYPINNRRVYVSGFYCGGHMAQRYTIERSSSVAGIASFSSYMIPNHPDTYVPTSVWLVHGLVDEVVPYYEGAGEPNDALRAALIEAGYIGSNATFDKWKVANGCTGSAQVTADGARAYTELYSNCVGGTQVKRLTLVDHAFPYYGSGGWSAPVDTLTRAWNFISPLQLTFGSDAVEPPSRSFTYGGATRTFWYTNAPTTAKGPWPLIVDLHAGTFPALFQFEVPTWRRIAPPAGLVVVWPQGLDNSWNAGGVLCGNSASRGVDDVGFLDQVINIMQSIHSIDPARIYVSGWHCGAHMAQRYAVERSSTIAGMAAYAGYMVPDPPEGFVPMNAWLIFGQYDETAPYIKGDGTGNLTKVAQGYIGAVETLNKWRDANGCTGSAVERQYWSGYAKPLISSSYTNCLDGTKVTLLTLPDGGGYPFLGVDAPFDTGTPAWNFISPSARDKEECFLWDGHERCFVHAAPSGGDGSPRPLLVDLHDHGSTMWETWNQNSWRRLFSTEGFVLVAANGLGGGWNAGGGYLCGDSAANAVDDVTFIDTVISAAKGLHAIDPTRVYISGTGCGCHMAQRYAAQRSFAVAAVACFAGYFIGSTGPEFLPTPVWIAFGTDDEETPYVAGAGFGDPEYIAAGYIGAVETRDKWAAANGCTGSAVQTFQAGNDFAQSYTSCTGGVVVTLLTIDGGVHPPLFGVPTTVGTTTRDTTTMAWTFLKGFAREVVFELPPAAIVPLEGVDRIFLHSPPSTGSGPFPLIVDLHPKDANMWFQALEVPSWNRVAPEVGAVMAWPQGYAGSWNAGSTMCGSAVTQGIDDVTFLDGVISVVSKLYSIDADRIYLSGFDCGCHMAQTYTIQRSSIVAAVAGFAGYLIPNPPADYTPTSALLVYGTADQVYPYVAGEDTGNQAAIDAGYIGAVETWLKWKTANGCVGDPVVTFTSGNNQALSYTSCLLGTQATLLTLPGVGHYPFKGVQTTLDTTAIAWDFLSQHTRSSPPPPAQVCALDAEQRAKKCACRYTWQETGAADVRVVCA